MLYDFVMGREVFFIQVGEERLVVLIVCIKNADWVVDCSE